MIGPILAIAKNTFQEAIRSNILIVCLVVLGVLCAFAPMFPALNDSHSRLKLALSISTSLCFYFGLIIIIFTSAAFLPEEISSKRIYTIFTKPVSRVQYLLGKLLGVFFLSFCLLFVFAIIVIGFVRLTYQSFDEQSKKSGESFLRTINPYTFESFKRFRYGKEVGEVPSHYFEVAYPQIDAKNFDGKLSFKILANYLKPEKTGKVYFDIFLYDATSKKEIFSMKEVEILDKKLVTIPFDLPLLKEVQTLKNVMIRVVIAQKSLDYISGISMKSSDFYLHQVSQPIELNILKCFFIFSLQFALLGFVAVAASTRMSYYIATIFALTTFAAGSLTGFLKEYMLDKEQKIHYKIIETDTFYAKVSHFLDQYMQVVCSIMPNFSKHDVSTQLIDGISLSFGKMFSISGHYGLYITAYLMLAAFMIWRREV